MAEQTYSPNIRRGSNRKPPPLLNQSMHLIPARKQLYQAKLGFWLFLGSLGMFFLASLLTYTIVRDQAFNPIADAVPGSILDQGPTHYTALELPTTFWLSTVVLVLISVGMHRATWLVRREQQAAFRNWLVLSAIAVCAFIIIQGLGLAQLMETHLSTSDGSTKVYGMSFSLSFIHALHVFGGAIFLGYVVYQANLGKYDHERHWAVDNCASYWHFLDAVWVCMLVTFVITQ